MSRKEITTREYRSYTITRREWTERAYGRKKSHGYRKVWHDRRRVTWSVRRPDGSHLRTLDRGRSLREAKRAIDRDLARTWFVTWNDSGMRVEKVNGYRTAGAAIAASGCPLGAAHDVKAHCADGMDEKLFRFLS